MDELKDIPVDLISRSPYQPRVVFNRSTLEELSESIRAQGVIQPITVRPLPGNPGHYELIAGERRWRACQLAGLHDVPALVRNVDDKTAAAMAVIENLERDDLNPLEEAYGYHKLVEHFGMTHEEVALDVGKSRAVVSNSLRLLNLSETSREYMLNGELFAGHGKILAGVEEPLQSQLARSVVRKKWAVRRLEMELKKFRSPESPKQASSSVASDEEYLTRISQSLSEYLGSAASLTKDSAGKWHLHITAHSLDELDGVIVDRIGFTYPQ